MAPIVLEDGEIFGTLCALDSEAVEISDEQHAVLVNLARLIARVYDDRRRKERLREVLYRLSHETERRERLIERIATDVAEPIEALAGSSEMLAQHTVADDARTATLQIMHANAQRVQTLVAELLRAEADADLEVADVDVSTLLREVAWHGQALAQPGVQVVADGDGMIRAPQQLLSRLLTTLVLGAAECTDAGVIRITGRLSEGGYVFELSDPGRALTGSERARLTRPGEQESATGRQRLPLSLAQHVAASFGAEIVVPKEAGGEAVEKATGSRVQVRLPASAVPSWASGTG